MLRDQCVECAEIIRTKAYKVCSDNESMCFFQRLIGDYNRYAYEALDLNWYVEPEKPPEKVEEVSAVRKKLMAEKKAIEEGLDLKDLKLDARGDPPTDGGENSSIGTSALSRKKKKKKKLAEEEQKAKEEEEAKKVEEKPHPK